MSVKKVLYLVNNNDTQSIPLEVGKFIRLEGAELVLAAYYRDGGYPVDRDGVQVINFGARFSFDLMALLRLWKFLRRERPAILHVHHTWSAVVGSILARLLGICIIKTEHNDHSFYKVYQTFLNGLSLPLSNAIICNSVNTKLSFNTWEKFWCYSKTFVIYNGVNFDRVERATGNSGKWRHNVSEAGILFGCVGRLVEQKNYVKLITAFARHTDNFEDSRMIIVGGGHQMQELNSLIQSLKINDRVLLTGAVPREDVYDILHNLDVFVIASLWEGFCNAAVEAMVAGLPIVHSNIETLNEVIGDNALVTFDPENVDDIVRALTECSEERHRFREIGLSSKNYATSKYSLGNTASSYAKLYQDFL